MDDTEILDILPTSLLPLQGNSESRSPAKSKLSLLIFK